jgi:hypothetical protein
VVWNHYHPFVASIYRRADGRLEIRESVSTPRGPRSRTLASFRGALTPEILERASDRASQPFDREKLLERVRALGVPVTRRREDRAARTLLAQLRRGNALHPVLASLLRAALSSPPLEEVHAELADVGEWVGASLAERGEALRGLLRVYDRIARSREAVRARPRQRFPRFSSEPA